MAIRAQNETALREYLLGTLPEPLWEEIETKLLTDDEFAETMDAIEDELIDDYLDGRLTRVERKAMENHFVRAPEHRKKLEFARLLRSHLRTPEKPVPLRFTPAFRAPMFYRILSAGFACFLLFTGGLGIYTARLRQELASERARNQKAEALLTARLREAQQRLEALEKKPEEKSPTILAYQSPLRLDLLASQTRESGDVPAINCSPGTSSIEVHIALVNGVAASYDAALYGLNGQKLWSKAGFSPVAAGSGKQLVLTIPNSLPCHRQYSLVIAGTGTGLNDNYAFGIR